MNSPADFDHSAPDPREIATQLTSSWSDAFAAVLQSMTGSRPEIALRASQSKTLEEAFSWWGQSLSILGQPSFWVGAPEESWSAIGRLTLSAFGAEEPSRAAVEAKCHDLMAQTSAVIASDLARRFGKEIAGGDTIPASRPDAAGGLVFKWSLDAGPVSMEGAVVWADSLLQWCSGLTPQRSGASACSEDASEASGDETLQLGGRPVASLPRLDLRVKFVLGRATLPLGDVFKLNTGSVIELDCSTAEPADVVIHGRVLARGEVVVVNGNYGLKILPHERTTRP